MLRLSRMASVGNLPLREVEGKQNSPPSSVRAIPLPSFVSLGVLLARITRSPPEISLTSRPDSNLVSCKVQDLGQMQEELRALSCETSCL